MSWNYRVVRRTVDGEDVFAIHECYYDDESKPASITTDSVEPSGETLEELKRDVDAYQRALTMPVLNFEDFDLPRRVRGVQLPGGGVERERGVEMKTRAKARTVMFEFIGQNINQDLHHFYGAVALHAVLLRGANYYGPGGEGVSWPKLAAEMAHRFAEAMVDQAPAFSTKTMVWTKKGSKK